MAAPLQQWTSTLAAPQASATSNVGGQAPLLTASSALIILRHRTGIPISRASFYRWLSNGKVFSVRMGQRLYIPSAVIERIVQLCQNGERLW